LSETGGIFPGKIFVLAAHFLAHDPGADLTGLDRSVQRFLVCRTEFVFALYKNLKPIAKAPLATNGGALRKIELH
jgi:hypothetical protein